MFKVLLTLSSYESKVEYERSFFITLRKNGCFSIGTRDENEIHYFETIEQAEEVIKYFSGGDFSYAFISDYEGNEIKSFYIRNEMRFFN
jgi:hypothetical protein